VVLGNAHAGMAEKDRDLVVGNAGQQHLDGKGIAEYVAVGALGRAVGIAQVDDREQATVAALPVGDVGLGRAVAAPEEIAKIGFEAGRDRAQQIGDLGLQRHEDRNASLGLVEHPFVVDQPRALKGAASRMRRPLQRIRSVKVRMGRMPRFSGPQERSAICDCMEAAGVERVFHRAT